MNTLFKTVTNSQNKKSVVPFQQFVDTEHKIIVEELELNMFIGILPEEKEHKQRVTIELEILLEPKISYEEKIDNTVSYADIITHIEELAASKHFNLVETLAEEISKFCLGNAAIQEVKIVVKKPDIIDNTKAVGFSMTRTKTK